MKKVLFLMILLIMSVITVQSQTVLFSDNFDSYTPGGFLASQSTSWTTWSNAPGGTEDATISTTYSHSPSNSVMIASGQDDIILKLGNKTSGKYSVLFYYYIPASFGGYFNIQHFEAPGTEWAIEVYFGNNGSGYSTVNSTDVNFAHLNGAWIEIETIVDLDLDSAWLYIDDLLVRDWIFSMQASESTGTKQLGGVNFYGGAITGQTVTYYFDDVTYTQLAAGTNPPEISVSTMSIATDGTANETVTVSNLGDDPMDFVAYVIYPQSGTKSLASTEEVILPVDNKLTIEQPTTIQLTAPFGLKNDKANELSYVSGALASGLGYGATVTVRSAVKFDYNFVKPFIGRELISVTIGVNDLPAGTTEVMVWERGSYVTPGAGTLIDSKAFTASTPASEVVVTLDNPIYLDGKDIWIGYVCDATGGTYPIGMDEGPRVPGVNWVSVGPGWSEVNLTVENNLYIMGTLQGSSLFQWLSVSPTSGTITGGSNQDLTATFNVGSLPSGNYFAQIVVGCNDQTQEYTEIDVNLTIGASINESGDLVAVMTYPNPVSDIFSLKANTEMLSIDVFSTNGQLVKTFSPKSDSYSFSVADLASGIYSVVITTNQEKINKQIVIE